MKSRDFTTRKEADIRIDVDRFRPIDSIGGKYPILRFTLMKVVPGFDQPIGKPKTVDSSYPASARVVMWSKVNPGTYHWDMEILYPHKESRIYRGSGSTAFEGGSLD